MQSITMENCFDGYKRSCSVYRCKRMHSVNLTRWLNANVVQQSVNYDIVDNQQTLNWTEMHTRTSTRASASSGQTVYSQIFNFVKSVTTSFLSVLYRTFLHGNTECISFLQNLILKRNREQRQFVSDIYWNIFHFKNKTLETEIEMEFCVLDPNKKISLTMQCSALCGLLFMSCLQPPYLRVIQQIFIFYGRIFFILGFEMKTQKC